MGIIELLLLATGLAMDAFAVSVCKGLSLRKISLKSCTICGAWFGSFQALMPLLGYIMGVSFYKYIEKIAPFIAFALLVLIGANMIKEALSKEDGLNDSLGFNTMFLMAMATSIDALAVGITFACVPIRIFDTSALLNTFFAVLIIGVITFILSLLGVKLGNIFGSKYKSKAETLGGLILILLGIKILLEHFKIL